MTEMRDARFKQALDAAPDADARPAPSVAESIRAAARNTPAQPLAATVPSTWWQRQWRNSGSPRAPWNAAFATLLLGVLVTVLWVQEPIPAAPPMAPAPAVGGVAPSVPSAPGAAPVTPAQAVADAARTPSTAPRAKQRVAEPAPAAASPAAADAGRATDAAKLVQPDLGPMQKRAAEQMANKALLADAARSTAPARQELPAAATMAAAPVPAAAAPAAVPAPAPAPVAPLRLDSQGVQGWSALALRLDTHGVTVDRVQGQALFAQLQRAVARLAPTAWPATAETSAASDAASNASATALPADAPRLRITVLQQDQTLAVFTLWANTVRWQRTGQPAVLGAIDAADAQLMMTLAQQALTAASPAPN